MNKTFDSQEQSPWELLKSKLPSGRKIGIGLIIVLAAFLATLSGALIETKEPDEILVIQSATTGELTWYSGTEAWVWQLFGTPTVYKKRDFYRFDSWVEGKGTIPDPDDPKKTIPDPGKCTNGIDVRFNDGGHGTICGSIQFDMPMDVESLNKIHTKFKGQEAVRAGLIETITGKSVYLSGPLMSSRASYAEKRNDLLFYIEDQIQHGVYKTVQVDKHLKDPITGLDRTATVTEIAIKDGKPQRQEVSVLDGYGIKAFNFAIKRLPYDKKVEAQIQQQQTITMEVQTSIADAKKAEQRALTVAEQGKATAAEAKWAQEAIKAKAVTEAEQQKAVAITAAEKERDVAKLQKDAAEFYKQQQILKGEGDAAYRQKVMQANGALEQKLATFENVMGKFAEEFGQQKWVPEVQMGGSGTSGSDSVQTMMGALVVPVLKQLGLDMKMQATSRTPEPTSAAPVPAAKK